MELEDLLFEADKNKWNSQANRSSEKQDEDSEVDKGPAPVYELEEEKTETLNFLGKDLTKKILKDGDGTELVDAAVIAEPKPRKSYKKRGFSESSKGSRPSSKKSKK